MLGVVFTLAFDSSPIKGEGDLVVLDLLFAPCCGYCLKAGMMVWWDCLAVTLTFDSSPIKGEGDSVGCVVLFIRVTQHPLWILP